MIFVDAHVHIYDCFDLKTFLNYARANFEVEAAKRNHYRSFGACLLLAETSGLNWFQRLVGYADNREWIGGSRADSWTFHRTGEVRSLIAKSYDGQELCVIAGRQIETREGLEVLALLTDKQFKDRSPLKEVIQSVREDGAIPVIPWGVGKWTGQRGVLLEKILKEVGNNLLFLGDNGGRPALWPHPAHFKEAERKRVRILQGSDPLPFFSESKRVARYGLIIQSSLSLDHPSTHLKRLLIDPEVTFEPY
jgi:hypothetical protein